MIKKIIFLFLLIVPMALRSQITISTQLPPAGLVPKDQLWNLILANNKEDILDLNIRMNVQDAISGEILMSANSGSFIVGKGVKVITSRDVQPIIYNYSMPDFSKNYLPMGTYTVCYQAYHNGQKGEEVLGEECVRINIDPLSPPLLNMPSDKSTVETPYPQFTWMQPTVFDQFTNLTYEILVAEVNEGQSPAEAIQYNTPVYWRSDIQRNNENYPTSYSALENNKTYAWQVIARNGQQYATKTEIWTFKLKNEKQDTAVENNYYVLLDDKVEGTYVITKDMLYIKYYSFDAAYETNIVVTSDAGKQVKEFKKQVKQGDNYFDLNIKNGFQKKEIYKVTITDAANRQHSLRFTIN